MGYVKNNERLYVRRVEGNYALETYYAGNWYKTAWFTKKQIRLKILKIDFLSIKRDNIKKEVN